MGLFARSVEQRSTDEQNEKIAKLLGIEVNGIASDKMKEATYYTCMRILTDAISKRKVEIYKADDNGIVTDTKHQVYRLLNLRPNKFMSASSFKKAVEFYRLHYGHSIVYIDRVKTGNDAGEIKGLYPLNTNRVRIVNDDANLFTNSTGLNINDNELWYIYTDYNGKEYKFRSGQVLHFTGLTCNGITGLSVQDYLKVTIENSQAGSKFVNNFFKGGLFAKGLLTYTSQIKEGAEVNMQKRFEKMASGLTNAGKILPVPLGFDFKSINTNMVDSQFLELSNFSVSQIASAFGVKLHQINNLEKSTLNNMEQQQKSFYIDTSMPIFVGYNQEYTYKLFTTNELNKGYYTEYDSNDIASLDFKTKMEGFGKAVQGGIMSPDEVRQKLNLSPKGNDRLICNGNMQYVDDIGALYKNKTQLNEKGGEGM